MNKEIKTFGFADLATQNKGNNKFLNSVNELIDWNRIEKIITKYDKRGKNAVGNSSYSGLLLFKMILLQTWFNLSDVEVEEASNDRISFMKFLDLSIESDIPDHSTISRFRTRLNSKNAFDMLFKEINKQLEEKELIVKTGAIIDASIISANRRPNKIVNMVEDRKEEDNSTTNQIEMDDIELSKDPDAKWIKKGSKSYFGYKIHNAVDENGFILGGSVSAANVADMRELENILDDINLPVGSAVMGDKGYAYPSLREELKKRKYEDFIMLKKKKNQVLSEFEKAFNKGISKIRYRVEQTFGVLKQHYNFTRVRYVGLEKVKMEYRIKSMALNIKKAVNIAF